MRNKIFIRFGIFVFSLFACAIPFIKVLFFEDRALLYRDIGRHFLPGKVYWARSVLEDGSIPLWNYSSFGGMPFWAENVNSPLHPLNFLFLLFPLERAPNVMNWFIYLHYPAILLGAYYLLRILQWQKPAALSMAYSLTISGTLLSAHNLCHSLFSFVAVPWFFAYWISYLRNQKTIHLFAAAFALSWPIYAGDPQFSYLLAISSFLVAWKIQSRKKIFFSVLYLGLLSICSAGAQLFPLLEMIYHSNRGLENLSRSELLYFSFHPIRFLESIYPQLFGNHIGDFSFWGQKYINFPFPSPFIFSTYPGFFVLITGILGIFSSLLHWRKISELYLICAFFLLSLLCLGAFSPIPLYEFFLDWIPLFQSFRYPERILFSLNFIFWLIACHYLHRKMQFNAYEKKSSKIGLGVLFFSYFALAISLYFFDWAPQINNVTLWGAAIFLCATALFFFFFQEKFYPKIIFLFLFLQMMEAFLVQEKLSWDSSVYITDKNRYPLIQEIQMDLKNRENQLQMGAARRYSSLEIGPRNVAPGALSHTNLSSFSTFEVATPNISSFYGIDDTSGYFALAPAKFEKLLLTIVGENRDEKMIQRFFDLTGTYYRSYRGSEQQIILEKRESALPYLFMPKVIRETTDLEKLWEKLRSIHLSKEALLWPQSPKIDQPEGAEFLNFRRSGSEMHVSVVSKNPNPWIIWNESNHDSWKPYVNSVSVEKKEANGFAMAVNLPKELSTAIDQGYRWELTFQFRSIWINLGIFTTSIFLISFVLMAILQIRNFYLRA
jgi:hypothetical protein